MEHVLRCLTGLTLTSLGPCNHVRTMYPSSLINSVNCRLFLPGTVLTDVCYPDIKLNFSYGKFPTHTKKYTK